MRWGALAYGQPATAPERRTVTAFVKRYYALAAVGDGARACGMLAPRLASAAREDYGHGSAGPSYLQAGYKCP